MSDVDVVLGRVLAELRPDRAERVAGNRAAVSVAGRDLVVEVRTRGRMMLRITDSTFVVAGPAWADPLVVEVSHTGRVRRTGTAVAVREGGDGARALARRLAEDPGLRDAALPLDFTRFVVRSVDGHLEAAITLMGASMTRMRIPPNTSWIRLHDDQREALLGTVAALDDVWATTPT